MQSLCPNVSNEHKHIYLDNTTAISYLRLRGRKPHLNSLAREIWVWCKDQKNIWLSCFYIAGRLNVTADSLSRPVGRSINSDIELDLSGTVFLKIQDLNGQFDIDLGQDMI